MHFLGVQEVATDDVQKYEVVRVADEITIDLLKKACEVTYENAGIERFEFKGVNIPIADINTMIKTKLGINQRIKKILHFSRVFLKTKASNFGGVLYKGNIVLDFFIQDRGVCKSLLTLRQKEPAAALRLGL